jgi:pimeloyl-ACP methyl ester carboxylesterase
MGGWLALHIALRRPERVAALVGIAAAPDFTDWGFDESIRAMLREHGRLQDPSGNRPVLTFDFWNSGQELRLLGGDLDLKCPVRLLHGNADREVPLDVGLRTLTALRSCDVQLTILKDGGHRLSEPHEIDALLRTVAALVEPQP